MINNYYETATEAIIMGTDTPLGTMTESIIIAIDTRVTVTKITTVIIQHRDIILSTRTDTTYTGVLDTIQSTAMGTITAGAAAAAGELGVTVVNRRKLYDILITLSLLYKMHFQHWFC